MLKDTIGYKFLTILETMRNNSKTTLDKIGITHGDFIILMYISENEGETQANLAEISRKDRNVIGRHIDVLEKKEFIERRRGTFDRRSYHIFLTELGKKISMIHANLIESSEKEALKNISEEELTELHTLLNKIIN